MSNLYQQDQAAEPRFKVAIVGSGPSGFYAAEALLRSGHCIDVDVYEKLPVPYGLVRFGVAPDHHKLKQVTSIFERIANLPGFRLIGNVCVGKDISIDDLDRCYNALIFANGAEKEKDLSIPGEDLPGSHSAREFVAWYNGHPYYRDRKFDFSCQTAVVIGQGNVALDIARILSKTPAELERTDIADHALEALSKSNIEKVYVIGRRGPVQTKFTNKELREFNDLEHCVTTAVPSEIALNAASKIEFEDPRSASIKINYGYIQEFSQNLPTKQKKQCIFRFHHSPIIIRGTDKVSRIVFQSNSLEGEPFHQRSVATEARMAIDCGLVFRCIGYKAEPMPGLHYNEGSGALANESGRLIFDGKVKPGFYAAGWIKRGPTGTIGTNRGDSVATVESVLEDMPSLRKEIASIDELLDHMRYQGHQILDFKDWKRIDAKEIELGKKKNKPRRKITKISEMLDMVSQR